LTQPLGTFLVLLVESYNTKELTMDLLLGALFIFAIIIAVYLLYKRIFNADRSKVDTEQEISAKEVLGKEISKFDKKDQKGLSDDSLDKE
jgi:hypothetical protein